MKLISCQIENFGSLSNVHIRFEDGLHTICQNNGYGKSTLAAFLRVMFYGFENEGVRKDVAITNEREKYRPWQGGTYGGSLVFSVGDDCYQISRIFHETKKNDEFELRDARSNRICDRFSSEIGMELFGVDAQSFARTALIHQDDCKTKATDKIAAKICNLSEMSDDLADFEEADTRLKDLLNEYSPNRKTGKIAKLREEVESLRVLIEQPERALRRSEGNERLRAYEEQLKEQTLTARDEERFEDLQELFTEGVPGEEQIDHMLDIAEKKRNRINSRNERQAKADAMEQMLRVKTVQQGGENTTRTVRKGRGAMWIVFGILISIISAAVGYFVSPYGYIGIAPGALCIIIGILIPTALRQIHEQDVEDDFGEEDEEDLDLDEDDLEEGDEDPREELDDLYHLIAQDDDYIRESTTTLRSFFELYGMEYVEKRDQMLLMELKSDIREYRDLKGRRAQQFHVQERYESELQKAAENLQEKEAELAKLQQFYQRIELTREYLSKARQTLGNQYMGPLMERFDAYYRQIDAEHADWFHMDADLNLTVQGGGMQRDIRTQSLGLQDLAGICLRMAFLDIMYPEEKCFLILDDPFVNLDEVHLNAAMELLEVVSKRYQIIYFTCHSVRS